jgi:hypothetical protein
MSSVIIVTFVVTKTIKPSYLSVKSTLTFTSKEKALLEIILLPMVLPLWLLAL